LARSPRRTRRHLIERTHSIDIRQLKRNGQIGAGAAFIMLSLVGGGHSCTIRLAHLERPVIGGVRTYFCCPSCDRRCDLLYSHPHIACRRCHKLAFASENETRMNRARRQFLKRRGRLGQTQGSVIAPFPNKPKWWRWPRYLRMRDDAILQGREYWRIVQKAMMKLF
jgi:hypothetical protein